MTARRTVSRLEAFAYAVRSLWGFHVIYGETGHGNLEMDRSHDSMTLIRAIRVRVLLFPPRIFCRHPCMDLTGPPIYARATQICCGHP